MRRFAFSLILAFLLVAVPAVSWRTFGWLEWTSLPGWLAIAYFENSGSISVSDWNGDFTSEGEALANVAAVAMWSLAAWTSSLLIRGRLRVQSRGRTPVERSPQTGG
jgi:hypothetical protein